MFSSNKQKINAPVEQAADSIRRPEERFSEPAAATASPAAASTVSAAQPYTAELIRPSDGCLLSAGTTFVGNINTSDNVTVAGKYEGELVSSNNITVLGSIKGNVTGKCIELRGSIEGDITVSENLNVSEKGAVKGNINAGKVNLQKDTCVNGDIIAASVHMEEGARVHGRVDIDANGSNR